MHVTPHVLSVKLTCGGSNNEVSTGVSNELFTILSSILIHLLLQCVPLLYIETSTSDDTP